MKKYLSTNFKSEAGVTLVELLVSIVILSILMSIFLGMFIQSSKVNVKSEEVIDATYVAQTEMENLYALSKETELNGREIAIIDVLGFPDVSNSEPDFQIFKKETDAYEIKLKVEKNPFTDPTEADYHTMTRAVLKVTGNKVIVGDSTTAEMELLLQWEVDSTP